MCSSGLGEGLSGAAFGKLLSKEPGVRAGHGCCRVFCNSLRDAELDVSGMTKENTLAKYVHQVKR